MNKKIIREALLDIRASGGWTEKRIDDVLAGLDKQDDAEVWINRFEQETIIRREWAIRAEQAEARVDALAAALAEAGIVLETINASVKWELCDSLKDGIKKALNKVRAALAVYRSGKPIAKTVPLAMLRECHRLPPLASDEFLIEEAARYGYIVGE